MSANPLFDGSLTVTIGGQVVTGALLPGLRYSTVMPGGFGEATLRLPATSPWAPYHAAVVRGAAVTIGHGATVLFEGEVAGDVSVAALQDGELYYDVACIGRYGKSKQMRADFVRGWVDSDLTQWYVSPSANRQFQMTIGDGILEGRLGKGSAVEGGFGAGIIYWLHGGLAVDSSEYIAHVEAVGSMDLAATNWFVRIATADSPHDIWTTQVEYNNTTFAPGQHFRWPTAEGASFPITVQALRILIISSADVAATLAARFYRLTGLRVYIGHASRRHVLAISSISVGSGTVTVTTTAAHELQTGDRVFIRGANSTPPVNGSHVITRTGAQTFTIPATTTGSGTTGSVTTGLRIEQVMGQVASLPGLATSMDVRPLTIAAPVRPSTVMARPWTSAGEYLDELAGLAEQRFSWGFWGGGQFAVTEQTPPGGAHPGRYLIDLTTPGIDYEVRRDDEGTPDYVRVRFRQVAPGGALDGVVSQVVVAAPGVTPTDPGLNDYTLRVAVLDLADTSMTAGQAAYVGRQYLSWLGRGAWNGTITIAAPTVPLFGGGSKATAHIRAGDWIEASGAGTGLLPIAETDYDVDRGLMRLTIGRGAGEFAVSLRGYRPVMHGGRPGPSPVIGRTRPGGGLSA